MHRISEKTGSRHSYFFNYLGTMDGTSSQWPRSITSDTSHCVYTGCEILPFFSIFLSATNVFIKKVNIRKSPYIILIEKKNVVHVFIVANNCEFVLRRPVARSCYVHSNVASAVPLVPKMRSCTPLKNISNEDIIAFFFRHT